MTSNYVKHSFDYIYEPGEDSYTLSDILETENIQNKIVLDLGCSTGIITKCLNNKNTVISLDINYKALDEVKNEGLNLINGDLLECINQKNIDIIVFNPPYVVENDDFLDSEGIKDHVLGGGIDGRTIIDRFLQMVDVPIIYLLVIQANKPKNIIKKMKNYKVEIKKVRKVPGETLIVLKCVKI
ncbi:hypothetical protein NUSPORA_02543 [Nucleospora cyclopteri]